MTISIGTDTRACVFGYGVEGRSAVRWLGRVGCRRVRVVSASRPDDLDPSIAWVSESDPDALSGLDVLIKSPGIKPSHPLLQAAASLGLPITSATVLFMARARDAGLALIGITGSKGKSTTATLIHRTLEEAGIPSVLLGNIGRSALDLVEQVVSNRPVIVLELSSYQTHDLTVGPKVAVVTRLFPEHLDWHGGVERYYEAKLRLTATQSEDDVTIWNGTDPEIAKRVPLGPARHIPYGLAPPRFSSRAMKLRGPHNLLNASAALAAAEIYGARPSHLESVLASFAGLPHRLEDLGVHGGVRWINDSIATAPEAAVAGLEAFSGEVGTYIGGGTDRGFDFAPLARALAAGAVRNVILLPPGGPAMQRAIPGSRVVSDLAEAVAIAARDTPAGSLVLFSPASPSYGVFENFEERGKLFRELVQAL